MQRGAVCKRYEPLDAERQIILKILKRRLQKKSEYKMEINVENFSGKIK